jgi:LysM repeat protein
MECYACDKEGEKQCPRCGSSFCDDHGTNLCAECLNPVNAAPSGGIFRLSIFALFGAAVLALWLLLRPPSLPSESSGLVQPTSSAPSATPSPSGTEQAAPGASPSQGASQTPAPTPAGSATPAPAAPTPIRYTVQDGDTLSSIAAAYGVSVTDLAAVNSLSNADFLSPGDVLVIPQ